MENFTSEQHYACLLGQVTSHAIVFLDNKGIIVEWSAGAEKLFGWSAAQAIGQPGSLILTPEDRHAGQHETEMRTARQSGQLLDRRWHLGRNGLKVFAESALSALRESDGTSLIGYAKILREVHAVPPVEMRQAASQRSGTLRVLVADDNMDMARMVAAMLQVDNHAVQIVTNGFEAIEKAKEYRPDIAILDIGMPDMTGYEVASELRKMPHLKHTVLVALTGWASEQDKTRSEQAGFDVHLTKPIGLDDINQLIGHISRL